MVTRLTRSIRNAISPKGLTSGTGGNGSSRRSSRTAQDLGVGRRRTKRIDEAVTRSSRGK